MIATGYRMAQAVLPDGYPCVTDVQEGLTGERQQRNHILRAGRGNVRPRGNHQLDIRFPRLSQRIWPVHKASVSLDGVLEAQGTVRATCRGPYVTVGTSPLTSHQWEPERRGAMQAANARRLAFV